MATPTISKKYTSGLRDAEAAQRRDYEAHAEARRKAQAVADAAQLELIEAQAELNTAKRALSNGDTSVTTEELARLNASVERLALIIEGQLHAVNSSDADSYITDTHVADAFLDVAKVALEGSHAEFASTFAADTPVPPTFPFLIVSSTASSTTDESGRLHGGVALRYYRLKSHSALDIEDIANVGESMDRLHIQRGQHGQLASSVHTFELDNEVYMDLCEMKLGQRRGEYSYAVPTIVELPTGDITRADAMAAFGGLIAPIWAAYQDQIDSRIVIQVPVDVDGGSVISDATTGDTRTIVLSGRIKMYPEHIEASVRHNSAYQYATPDKQPTALNLLNAMPSPKGKFIQYAGHCTEAAYRPIVTQRGGQLSTEARIELTCVSTVPRAGN